MRSDHAFVRYVTLIYSDVGGAFLRGSMVKLHLLILACLGSGVAAGFGSPTAAGEISIERGLQVSLLAGCHDCHTEGYRASEGQIDSTKAMKGSSIGWQGPWGTTYPPNLRLTAASLSEDDFVSFYRAKTPKMFPPMPWYRLTMISEDDFRSLYRYIKSLGEPGKPVPVFVPPGERVKTPYIVLDPPQQPSPCTRDLDCGVGEICGKAEPRSCVRRE
jgi:mono/diheme cytochrome c family protein